MGGINKNGGIGTAMNKQALGGADMYGGGLFPSPIQRVTCTAWCSLFKLLADAAAMHNDGKEQSTDLVKLAQVQHELVCTGSRLALVQHRVVLAQARSHVIGIQDGQLGGLQPKASKRSSLLIKGAHEDRSQQLANALTD